MIYYAPIAKAIRQSRTSPPGVPLAAVPPLFSAGSDVSALCIDRTGRGNNRIHNNEKAKTSTRKEKQKQSRSGDYIKIPNKQKEKQAITAKQDKEKSKRDPRKAYKQTSKREKKAILFPPMPIYKIAIYYNKAI